ncbi:transcriptional regulator, AraC family [Catenulispora acidiphila DSM 44928]|uniref:Transcriptional regulator, AraC family n=1 Tax=Catenulispora acidiphila (strain DSM 44928 / JCM 14897 / NBRC 102108 / NRRL B-24433 / ID139908) TaxID=479433 RepID=C7Q7L5_CATAD|nr:AraC family transcriptional regulator [Catenulispora acidiphila]ACU72208.1 transcriptional regulator, AraC family [Catenulispora acidiphila DSM 44928]
MSSQNLLERSAEPVTPGENDDPLCAALAVADARAAMSGAFVAGGDWAVRLHAPDRLKVNCVMRGTPVLVRQDTGEQLRLAPGDVIVSDGALPYVLCSDPSIEPHPSGWLATDPRTGFRRIGHGEDVMCVAGHVDLSRDGGGLLRSALPNLLHIPGDAPEATPLRRLIEQLLDEMTTRRPGAPAAMDHIAQLIFLHVLRISLTTTATLPPGWLRGLADPRISPALHLMHRDPARPWRLEELAQAAALSRTAFAVRFRATVGVPPLTYLLTWRMSLAARALRRDTTPVAVLAREVGYGSESAFSNAFKRAVGTSPRNYRNRSSVGGDAEAEAG